MSWGGPEQGGPVPPVPQHPPPHSPRWGWRGGQQGGGQDGGEVARGGQRSAVGWGGPPGRPHAAQEATDAHPEGHCQASQQPHDGTLGQGRGRALTPGRARWGSPCRRPARGTLTVGLAQGKNMPRQKSPRSGPPTMPKMLMAACGDSPPSAPAPRPGWEPELRGSRTPGGPYLQHRAQHGGHVSHPQAQQPVTQSWREQRAGQGDAGDPPPASVSPPCPPAPDSPLLTQQLGETGGP